MKFLLWITLFSVVAAGSSFGQFAFDNFDDYLGSDAGNTFPSPAGPTVNQSGWLAGWTGSANSTIIDVGGGDRALKLSGGNNTFAAQRTFSAAQTGEIWLSFDFVFSGVLNDQDFFSLWLSNSSSDLSRHLGPNIGLKGNENGTGTKDLFARVAASQINAESFALDVGTGSGTFSHQIVGRLSKLGDTSVSGAYDRFDIWVDPMYNPLLSDAFSTTAGTLTSISTIGFRLANWDTSPGSGDMVTINNLKFGTSINDVVADAEVIPEPSTYALIFGGLVLGVVIFRRKLGKREALEAAA